MDGRGRVVALSDEERAQIAEQFKSEIEAKYKRRAEIAASKNTESEADREAELAVLRAQVLEKFHEEHGYQKYVDSRGNSRWVSPEEYERLRTRRRRKKANTFRPVWAGTGRRGVFFVAVMLVAIVLGIVLAR